MVDFPRKKPWPKDCVVIVCATPEAALRGEMESALPAVCADCQRPLVVDSYTLRAAADPRIACGRPPRTICKLCFAHYDFGQVTHVQDHTGRKKQAR